MENGDHVQFDDGQAGAKSIIGALVLMAFSTANVTPISGYLPKRRVLTPASTLLNARKCAAKNEKMFEDPSKVFSTDLTD